MKPIAIAKVKIPPILLMAFILSIPLAAQKVTIARKTTSKIPKSWVEVNGPKYQLCVVSCPNIAVDTETKKNWVDETNQTTQADSQIKVPMNATFSLVEPSNQENIPPLIPLKAAPYSAKINADGKKNKIADTIYQMILA